ncbi:MAG TPA: hypothetical protein VLN61_06070 [Pseudolabrys sp.]|nr:hypothetical protein [Pseudolabrys sp.]
MRIGRIIFTALIALSVATLPAAIGFAAGATTAMEISASQAMPDCDHHHNAPGGKTQKSMDDCASMAGCALKCFNFTGTILADIAYSPPASAALKPARTSSNISSLMGSPPFRPPRS